jgi:protein TonB
MSKSLWIGLGVLSAAAHVAIGVAMARIPKESAHKATAVTIANQKKAKRDEDKPKDDNKPPEPPKPIKAPPRILRPAAAEPPPPAQNTPPPPPVANTPQAAQALAAMPDFGLSLAGGVGPGGIAVPVGPAAPAQQAAGPKATAAAPKAAAPPKGDDCTEDLVKPKALGAVQPQYTEEARAAGVEGRVRVSLTVDATGTVTSASVLSGLGHGLDQAAISAAKRMKFTPGSRCGKPVEASFVVTMRFALGD